MSRARAATAARWLRRNLFAGPWSALLTLAMAALFALVLPPLARWTLVDAEFWGQSRQACSADGACWAFVTARAGFFVYGAYPPEERWRPDLVFLLFFLFAVPAFRERAAGRASRVILLVTLFPLLAGVLLWGGILGLPYVDTARWGGLMVNCVLAFAAVAGSLPLGVLLALGRRSSLPVVRGFCVAFIELWRGVPLLTVIFMAAVMLPLFLPEGASLDRLIRAMVALTLFTAAYMAEVVRGGLQGIPRGQPEAAYSLGLGYWQVQALVVLPQALRTVLPAIVNTVIDLFKDTTLVAIVGISDLLGVVNLALRDQAWLGLAREGYVFAGLVFFVCCFAVSRFSARLERRLAVEHRRGAA
jgi:general L-amino acid transport system permease protein